MLRSRIRSIHIITSRSANLSDCVQHKLAIMLRMRILPLFILLLSATAFGQSFPIFDGTLYQGKPQLPLKPITIIYSGDLWKGANRENIPDVATIANLAKKAQATGIGVIDVEHWPMDQTGFGKYESLLQEFKRVGPRVKFGFYGIVPIRNYWGAIQGKGKPGYLEWQKKNAGAEPIGQTSDIIFPSLYTLYDDREGWQKYAIAQIQEVRKYGKPVYVFLWPEYADLSGRYIPADFWNMELQTARKYADGIVIWGGENNQKWDDQAPWWKVTLRFIGSTK